MPDETNNPIERREPGGGIGRRSDIARRGMNASNYVSGLAAREETDLLRRPPSTEYTYEFLRKWGTEGEEDGQFDSPEKLAIDGDGNVYVSDNNNHRIQVFDLQGRFLGKWGGRGEDDGQFIHPQGLAIDCEGNLYVVDHNHSRIQVFDLQGRFLSKWGTEGEEDGQFNWPNGLAIDGYGNVYVVEWLNHRIQVFQPVTTIAK